MYRASPPVHVYTVRSPGRAEEISLHTYPAGAVDRALGLEGEDGLLSLRAVAVAGGSGGAGPADYQSFAVGDDSSLSYRGAGSGGWVVYPSAGGGGDWDAKWYDGVLSSCFVGCMMGCLLTWKVQAGP